MKNTFDFHDKMNNFKGIYLKEKGVTLIALMVTIIILIILASVAVYSGTETIQSSHFTTFTTDLKVVQAEVNNWYQQYKDGGTVGDKNGDEILELGKELTTSTTVENQANRVFVEDESGITSQDGYRYFSANELKDLGLDEIDRDFFINVGKRSVVSFQGYDYEGNRYYTVEQIENGMYNVEFESNTGTPKFQVSYETIPGGGYKIKVTDITYSGNINKWYIKYQKEGETDWITTENTEFTVSDAGIYNIIVENGNVSGQGTCEIKADTLDSVTGYEIANTKVKDNWGNEVWIPAGFKVQEASVNSNVADGIVIEDVSHVNTKGSTFVWIPVGDITTRTATESVSLDRYSFDKTTGEATGKGNASISGTTENLTSNFLSSVEEHGGYYIAQYEARDGNASGSRTSSTLDTNQVVVIKDKPIYNWVTRDQAKTQSEAMYSDTNFESELINGYAWDTALVFIQKFSDNSKYSLEYSVNNKDNGISQNGTTDSKCNIYDMASNCFEFSTEIGSSSSPAVGRGGSYQFATLDNASSRNIYGTNINYEYASFRPILYLN